MVKRTWCDMKGRASHEERTHGLADEKVRAVGDYEVGVSLFPVVGVNLEGDADAPTEGTITDSLPSADSGEGVLSMALSCDDNVPPDPSDPPDTLDLRLISAEVTIVGRWAGVTLVEVPGR